MAGELSKVFSCAQSLDAPSEYFYNKSLPLKPCACLSTFGLRGSGLKTTLHENTDEKPVLKCRRGQEKGP